MGDFYFRINKVYYHLLKATFILKWLCQPPLSKRTHIITIVKANYHPSYNIKYMNLISGITLQSVVPKSNTSLGKVSKL